MNLVGFLCRRVHPDLRRDWKLLFPCGRAKGSHLPNPDLLCQREDQGDQTTCSQPPWRSSTAWQEWELGRQDAEDPTHIAFHSGLQHHPCGIFTYGESTICLIRDKANCMPISALHLTSCFSTGVCGHPSSCQLDPEPALGDRHHSPPLLRQSHLFCQQSVQHGYELVGIAWETWRYGTSP